ncbi:hypothetical protein Adt_26289 [Abeliophyllum distichum]|uniref:Uncharacterized protein n=1 Tax=Abeliophyllum distichum TaxID=126358 RepID=A0ABD1RQU2_9LAMI
MDDFDDSGGSTTNGGGRGKYRIVKESYFLVGVAVRVMLKVEVMAVLMRLNLESWKEETAKKVHRTSGDVELGFVGQRCWVGSAIGDGDGGCFAAVRNLFG